MSVAFRSLVNDMVPIFMDMMVYTELSGRKEKIYELSVASISDSGITFGRCQFDIANNGTAKNIVLSLGFSQDELAELQKIDSPNLLRGPLVDLLREKVKSPQGKLLIDQADKKRAEWCINNVLNVFGDSENLFHMEQVFHLADMANQYGAFTKTGVTRKWVDTEKAHEGKNLVTWLNKFKEFKKTKTKHGRDFPKDVERRFKEIRNFFFKLSI